MDKDQKLVNDINALLREAGYTGLNAHTDQDGTLLSGTREHGGVMVRVSTDMKKAGRRIEGGGAEAHSERLDVHEVPVMEGLEQQLRANPGLAKVMGIPAAHLKYIM
ncbi:hypothetical protein GTP91_12250 [Rugamonas sp. FT82W]|uniref:Uncharacterized protein n=1 Tax=Duganella vulcania TaxID=2692166 RepID=A0A845G5F6_9BURK|nr:hypothetical protein [Duganella vulcania]MYM87948.1 hypothetical protein [Duganella vulcania]